MMFYPNMQHAVNAPTFNKKEVKFNGDSTEQKWQVKFEEKIIKQLHSIYVNGTKLVTSIKYSF